MSRELSIYLLLITFLSHTAFTQDLKKKREKNDEFTEEYFVLKDDKSIKHGQSITYHIGVLDKKYVKEYGQFQHNIKSGVWFEFYFKNSSNFLKGFGSYKNNQKEGEWLYYWPGSSSNQLTTLFGTEKRTLVEYNRKKKVFSVQIDSVGQPIMSTGLYSNGEKSGIWKYFSYSGYLLHKYNHSSAELVENDFRERGFEFITYLGGIGRFQNLYFSANSERSDRYDINATSVVTFEVERNGNYKFISAYGDAKYKKIVVKILESIPNDWIYIGEDGNSKLQLIFKVVFDKDNFKRYSYSIDRKVVLGN